MYKIVRHFFNGDQELVKDELTLKEAQEWCRDPETSSCSATSDEAVKLTAERGEWFDGFDKM